MTARFKLDVTQGLVVGRLEGRATAEEIIESFGDEIARTKGAALHSDMFVVLDKHADMGALSFSALMRIKSQFEIWAERFPGRNVRTAIVVPDWSGWATISLWKALTDLFPRIGGRPRIFMTEAEALAWLKGGEEARH